MHNQPIVSRFILIEPSHAGNVGAVARALKVMGFADLVLVRPRWADVLQRPEALERASGAADVLAAARVCATLDEALGGITHLCATAMTARDFGPPTLAPREHLGAWVQAQRAAPAAAHGVAFVFGPERYGLSNGDVYRCHASLRIPTSPGYGSLNLAAAVQLIAYEWRLALGGFEPHTNDRAGDRAHDRAGQHTDDRAIDHTDDRPDQLPGAPAPTPRNAADTPADAATVAAALAHWQEALVALQYLDPAAPKKLLPRLQQLLNRAQPTLAEIHILRGVARAVLRLAQTKG